MRTKQEIIDFLESKVGTKVKCVGNSSLDGQCVTLIKSLMDFLGVPNPYKARGHANTAITAYLNEGIADKGTGFISVFSNKNMAGSYGHIWCNAGEGDGTYYESNGVKSLMVTKGKTYSYDSVCNLDKYIKQESTTEPTPEPENDVLEFLNAGNSDEAKKKLIEHLGQDDNQRCNWGSDQGAGWLGQEREKNRVLTEENNKLKEETSSLRGENTAIKASYSDLQKKTDSFKSQLAQKLGTSNDESSIIGEVERLITSESDGVKKAKDLQNAMDEQKKKHDEEREQLKSEIESYKQDIDRLSKQADNFLNRITELEAQKETTKRINLVIADIINFFKKGK